MEKIKPETVAKLFNCSAQAIRVGLQRKLFPIGEAVKINGSNYTYIILEDKLAAYMGITRETLQERIREL